MQSPRWVYIGRCLDCNAAIYYNEQEEKYSSNSDVPNHQCTWDEEDES